jgi:hypothetical protein
MTNPQKKIWQEEKAQMQNDKQSPQVIRRPVKLKFGAKSATTPDASVPEIMPDDLLRRQLGI